ncbi:hypothetical protein PTKIN_Ptkin01aG0313200 [Pterospermum kingtungense]
MEFLSRCASNLAAKVAEFMFKNVNLHISYAFYHKRRVANFEKKIETLKERRDRVQHDVEAAERNAENIETDVNNWLTKVDEKINAEAKQVRELQAKAENKCFIGLCPNFKSRYQLSKKAAEETNIVDELLQQGRFDKVSYRGDPQALELAFPTNFEAFDSRKLVFKEILEAIRDPSINIIGVYGMAGVGKTTLIYEVIRQVKVDKSFDSVVMAAVTNNPDIREIQDRVADMLGLKFEEQSSYGRGIRLRERMKKEERIFVVLDDIWARLDLMEVGIPVGGEHKGCTVLLTSRARDVLLVNDVDARETFEIGVLNQEEGRDLFKKTAGIGSPDLGSEIEVDTVIEVADKCARLPIAITTVARVLRNQDSFAWRDALRQLNNPSPSNFSGPLAIAYSAIELSFNNLKGEELKTAFLLCALLGHNAFLQDLLKYAMGLGLFDGVRTVEETRARLLTVVSSLKASRLLLDSYNKERFDMHDLICDVAISIASRDNPVFALRHKDVLGRDDWPDEETTKRWDKFSLKLATISKLPDQLKCPKLTFFHLESKDPSMEIPKDFFGEMGNLKVLDLTRMHFPSLPSSICVLANLRTLCLDHCVLGDIAIVGELKNLVILSLLNSDIETLPKEIAQLLKLKMLDLTGSTKLQIIPPIVLASLSRLEELYMGNSFAKWEAEGCPSERSNASLAELKALSCLTALDVHIPNAEIIPKDIFFQKLQRYNILIGEAWEWDNEIEYKRTLKLKLHTNIGHLSHGMRMLLMKAENLYVDAMKGVEILLHNSEVRECFQQLKNLHIQNGALIQNIIKDDGVDKIEFVQLNSLTLQGLPKLVSFCSQNKGSTSMSPQGLPLFNEKIWQYQLPKGSHSFPNLTSLIIKGCGNLKHVLSFSMAECLLQLKSLEIIDCNSIQLIISTEETLTKEDGKKAIISFPQLNSVKLRGLHKLFGFCHEVYTVQFQSLNILNISHCPQLKGFIITNKTLGKHIAPGCTIDEVLFNEKVAFPSLEKMTISHLRNVKGIWHNQLHQGSFCNLKELKVEYCEGLSNIFSSSLLGVFQRHLEMLTVTGCTSLQHVFELHGPDIEETCVFQNLRVVTVGKCWCLKSLFPFSIAKGLLYLKSLQVDNCGLEQIVSEKIIEGLQQDICFKFSQLSILMLWNLPELKCFYPGVHTTVWPVLEKLKTWRCEKIKIFGNGKSNSEIQQPLFLVERDISRLEEVFFSSDDIAMICDGQFGPNFFGHIKVLGITGYLDESIAFPFCFLQKFHNLQMLEVRGCDFKELSPCEDDHAREEKDMIWTLPKIKKLKLNGCNKIKQLWKQGSRMDHICAGLESLQVQICLSLTNLASASSSFQNLTYLEVWECKEMTQLIVSSKAQCLGCLVRMRIGHCEMMTEIVASEGGDEATYEIIFRELKHLELHCLHSLKSFSSGKYSFKFPSLEQVYVDQCPRLKRFCEGALSSPKLKRIHQRKKNSCEHHWVRDLNATIEQLHEKKIGFHGLKQLKFSEFPELLEIWNRNLQERLDFENLEFLEVCNSDNLSCIFTLSMALSRLGRLQQLEIKRCNKMEQVVKETEGSVVEEAAKPDNNKIIIMFPRLQSVLIESCPDLTSFYLGSAALEFPSLETIQVADCPNMTTFASASARDEHMKEAIIGEETETNKDDHHIPTTFFCNELVLPKLSSVGIERIWQYQIPRGSHSFPNLTSLIIKGCGNLKHVLSFSMVEYLLQLKSLEIVDCNSIQLIISTEETLTKEDGKRAVISFPQLNFVKLKGLHKLIGFCHEDYILQFQSLNILEIAHCPELKGFVINKSMGKDIATSSSIDEALFNEKVAFPSLEKMTISHLRNVKRIWHNQLHQDSFCNLKELKVEYCEGLLNIFSSSLLGVFQRRLEMLTVTDCASLEQVFELQGLDIKETCVLAVQLREMCLIRLPKLKNVWSKDPQGKYSFQNVQ